MSRRQRRARLERRRHAAISRRAATAGGLAVAATLLSGSVAEAAPFTVMNTDPSGSGSLADAIAAANMAGGSNTILFASGVSGSIDLASALPTVTSPLTITGPGARTLTVNGDGHPIFDFNFGTMASPADTISGLTLTGGHTSADGGAVYSSDPQLILVGDTISGSSARYGGGVFANGQLSVDDSTISGNTAEFGGGLEAYYGLNLSNSTIAGNDATTDGGGGIAMSSASTMLISHSTISGNEADGATAKGGGIYIDKNLTSARLENTIVSGNGAAAGTDIFTGIGGVVPTASFSLIEVYSGSGITSDGTDLLGSDPQLGPLENNGGPTDTMMPRLDSPVVNKGKAFGATQDQRGLTRPVDLPGIANAPGGDGSDIGAVEIQTDETTSAIFKVTNTNDSGSGSLRAAIDGVNGHPGRNTIVFTGLSGSIDLASSLPWIYQPVTIDGPGARTLTINGDGHRLFEFINGEVTSQLDEISGLTLIGGSTDASGGAVDSTGYQQLVLKQDTISHSTATGYGGGVFAIGQLSISQSTISDNAGSRGGGIAAVNGLALADSTVTGNTATVEGGGVYAGPQTVEIQDSTISGNKASGATAQGGGLHIDKGALSATLDDTIVSGNTAASGPDIFTTPGGVVPLAAFSLIGNLTASGITAASTDITGKNPLLGALANNGGPTDTMLPADNSPVIDQGSAFGATQDQRELPRPVDLPAYPNAPGGDGSDIGAVELQPSEVPQMMMSKFDGQELTLTTPSRESCTAPTTGLPVKFSSTPSSKSTVKFRSAAFYIDKGIKHSRKVVKRLKNGKRKKVTVVTYLPNALARHASSSLSLKLTGEKAGTHTLKVIVSYSEKVTKHHRKVTTTVTKTLKVTFKVC